MHAYVVASCINAKRNACIPEKEADKYDDATDQPGQSSDLVLDDGNDVSMAVWAVGASWIIAELM